MVEQYDPGSRSAEIARVFTDLKAFLKGFIPEALEAQARRRAKHPLKPFEGPFPIEKQKALGLELMKAVGFDFHHGRLDISHHPFCGGVPSDVRMTTRYRTDEFLSSLMGILHETGHGLYEQNLPHDLSHWPSMQGARHGDAREPEPVPGNAAVAPAGVLGLRPAEGAGHSGARAMSSVDDMLAHVHRVERGFIRVDADEATYPLHVILRFEIEQELVTGKLAAKDVPEALGREDARISRPLDGGQLQGRADAGRALAVRRLRLFPELHAGRHDGGPAMGGGGARRARCGGADRARAISPASMPGARRTSGRRPRCSRRPRSCGRRRASR